MNNRDGFRFTMFSHDVQWGIVAFLAFPITIWFIWIFFIYKFIFYRQTKKALLKKSFKQSITKRDKRYTKGYRVDGYINASKYEWFDATDQELGLNKKKANIFLIYFIVNIILIVAWLK